MTKGRFGLQRSPSMEFKDLTKKDAQISLAMELDKLTMTAPVGAREEMEQNPLTVLPANRPTADGLSAVDAELVGNYAIRIKFSDGHETGIFTWHYLRRIDPDAPESQEDGAS